MQIDIKEVEKVKLKNPVIIEGFPGIGMIGTIAASYLSEKLQMKLIGYISSSHFPPIAAIHDYIPMSPARIYASEKHDLIVLFSEFIIPAEIVYSLSQRILKYAHEKNAKAIYSLAGIAAENPTTKIYGISSTKEIADVLKKHDVELIREGATQGVSGILIAECASTKFPAANLLIQTANPMEPRGAAKLLDKVSEIISVPFDTKALVDESEVIEAKIKDSLEKMKSMHTKYSALEENPMYA